MIRSLSRNGTHHLAYFPTVAPHASLPHSRFCLRSSHLSRTRVCRDLVCRAHVTRDTRQTKRALMPRDFEFLKLIGRGTFGRVFQVRKKDTKRIYAMKVLSKREIIAKKEVAHTIGERKILQRSLDSPFLVGLKFSFQTDTDLYLVTDFKSGGELFWHLQRETRFSEERARFYVAELILALEHLHKYDIVYRYVLLAATVCLGPSTDLVTGISSQKTSCSMRQVTSLFVTLGSRSQISGQTS